MIRDFNHHSPLKNSWGAILNTHEPIGKIHVSPDGKLRCFHMNVRHMDDAVLLKVKGRELVAIYSNYTWSWSIYDVKTRSEFCSNMKDDLFELAFRPHFVGPIRLLPYGVTCEQFFANPGKAVSH